MKIISWNVNGIRAIDRKGFFDWFKNESPDILCLQEIKAMKEQVPPHIKNIPGYFINWNSAERKGYSGVVTFSKKKPINIKKGFGNKKFDFEGRVLISEFEDFTLLNIYFPNGKKNKDRLEFKLNFYDVFLSFADKLVKDGINVIVCGDFNTAHKEIDLARPKENSKFSGFLPVEREWIDRFIDYGFIDTFRYFNKNPEQYSWWDYKTRARDRNIGWRIDYFFINKEFLPSLINATIMKDVMGSDHCPIGIEILDNMENEK
jgi:exodeoxyribonuclease-3